jgi:hypothetical protein
MAIIASATQPEMSSYRDLPPPAQMMSVVFPSVTMYPTNPTIVSLISPFTSLSEPLNQFSSFYYNAPYDFVDCASLSQFAQLVSGAR